MGHQHNNAPVFPQRLDCLNQGEFAVVVEIGIRLIQDDQERIAKHGAREPDALPLAGREA